MTPGKVLMLTTGFPRFVGDLFGSFVFEQARALAARGVAVDVLAPHERGIARSEEVCGVGVRRFRYAWPAALQKVAYGGGIPTNVRRSWLVRFELPFFLLGYVLGARRCAGRVDLVHCHWTVSGLVALWAFGRKKKIVLSVRGSDVNLFNRGILRRLNGYITGRMDRIVAVSADIREQLAAGGVEREKIAVIYNGVDERFCPGDRERQRQVLEIPHDHFVLLFVGLLVPVKGVEILLEALEAWQGESNWTCLLVGDGPLSDELKARCVELGVADAVRFVGRRPSGEIPQWMQAADVLVLPSYSEGRPNVVLEAQACGLPVVATRVGGTPELVCDGETGVLVDSGSAEQLRIALDALRKEPARRSEMGRQARRHVEESGQTWARSAEALHALYADVLEES